MDVADQIRSVSIAQFTLLKKILRKWASRSSMKAIAVHVYHFASSSGVNACFYISFVACFSLAEGHPSNLGARDDVLQQNEEIKRTLTAVKSSPSARDGMKDEETLGPEYLGDRDRIMREAVGRFRQGIGGQHPGKKLSFSCFSSFL